MAVGLVGGVWRGGGGVGEMGRKEWGMGEKKRRAYTKAEHYRVCVVVGKRSQAVEFFLSGRVP